MRQRSLRMQSFGVATALFLLWTASVASEEPGKAPMHKMEGMEDAGAMDISMGKMVYTMSCIYCHGAKGRGDGAASIFIGPYMHPRPNDFTQGIFKFRSTPSGELPMLAGLMRT